MRLIGIMLCFLLYSCGRQKGSIEVDRQELECHSLTMNIARPFPVLSREAKGLLRVHDYLQLQGMNTDSLYVYNIDYSDSLCTVSNDSNEKDPLNACFAIFNIVHKINIDYYKEIEEENMKSIKEARDKDEWTPLIIPSTPAFLKKDIIAYYYFAQDSIAIQDYNLQ